MAHGHHIMKARSLEGLDASMRCHVRYANHPQAMCMAAVLRHLSRLPRQNLGLEFMLRLVCMEGA